MKVKIEIDGYPPEAGDVHSITSGAYEFSQPDFRYIEDELKRNPNAACVIRRRTWPSGTSIVDFTFGIMPPPESQDPATMELMKPSQKGKQK